MAGKGRSVSKVFKRKFINAVREGNFEEFSSLCKENKNVLRSLVNGFPMWLFVLSKGSREMVRLTVKEILSEFSPFKFRGRWVEVVMAVKSKEALRVMCKEFGELLLKEREFFGRKSEKLINQILIELAKEGRREEVEILLKEFPGEINVNAQDEAGNTPLHYGAYKGDRKLVEALIKAGGRVDIPNSVGLTPEGILRFKEIEVGA
ncbi:ankyrin repeat domain-containing protein [Thermovibrio sp.]